MSVSSSPPGLQASPPSLRGERAYQVVTTGALALLGFFVLFSSAGTSIAIGLLLLLAAAAPHKVWQTRPWREPVHVLSLLLLAYIVLRSFAQDGSTADAIVAVRKYQELLLIPLFWTMMRTARRPQVFAVALVVAAVLLAAAYWAGFLLGLTEAQPVGAWLQTRRISAGFDLAICAFVLFEHARLRKLPPRLAYGLSFLLAATVLFAMESRTGHVILLLLMLCAALRAASRRGRFAAVVATLAGAVLLGALSPTVRHRVTQSLGEWHLAMQGQVAGDSSTGIRFEMWQNAVVVARENWLGGIGLQNYQSAANEVARRRHAGAQPGAASDNPHSEYLMQLAAGGATGLLLFLLWLGWPVFQALRGPRRGLPWTGAIACVAIAFAAGSVFNSLLLDFMEAHFYAALLAWLLVRRLEP
jgi:O-antigen ligase